MAQVNKSYMGKGTIYVKEKGQVLAGAISLGNCSQLDLAFNENKLEQKDYQDAGGATINTVANVESVVATVTALSLHPENVKLALRGLIAKNAAGGVTDEPAVAFPDGYIPFAFPYDKSVDPVVTDQSGSTTYVEGRDYELKNAGILILSGTGATITSPNTAIKLDYTKAASTTIEGLMEATKDYEVFFDGLNEAESGKAVSIVMHKVKFNYTQALAIISDDFGSLPMTFDILKDDSITSSSKSKFLKITQID